MHSTHLMKTPPPARSTHSTPKTTTLRIQIANHKKPYFLVPGWDMPAAALSLGDILTDPQHHAADAPPRQRARPPQRARPLHLHPFERHKHEARPLDAVPPDLRPRAEGAVTFGLDDGDVYKCEKMETGWCAPPAAFVQQALARDDDGVQGYLAFGEFGASRRVS